MEAELNCPVCNNLLNQAVLLSCSHNVCFNCLEMILTVGSGEANADAASDDSGYLSIGEINGHMRSNCNGQLTCPRCSRHFALDERGIDGLQKNLILDGLVQRQRAKSKAVECQLCEGSPPAKAELMCEQCEVAYCDRCLATCHPMRGPLAKHSLVPPNSERVADVGTKSRGILKCSEHEEENLSMYCLACQLPACYVCFERGRHEGHDTRALGSMFKEQKGELLRSVKVLTEKNKALQAFLLEIQQSIDKLQENGVDFESRIVAQFDSVVMLIEKKKRELLKDIAIDLENRRNMLRNQLGDSKQLMKDTTGLLQYAIEVLKEGDPAVFLQVANSLNSRLQVTAKALLGDGKGLEPMVSPEIDLKMDVTPLVQTIEELDFTQLKIPGRPDIVTEKCSVTNNTLVLCWQPLGEGLADGFVVQLDDGIGGAMTTVDHTKETTCTIEHLEFQSTYKAHVKAVNRAGHSEFSDIVYLTTPQVAVFALDPSKAHKDIQLMNENCTMTCTSYESRVVLADIGFSRGKHYWEVCIDRFEGNPDPAVGIATVTAAKDTILGKDDHAWSVYVDSTRSWFQHNNEHLYRTDGGISVASTLGLLLDLDCYTLTFFCNDDRRGPVHFPTLATARTVYPAFSMNRNVTMTLHSGMDLPDELQ